MGQAKTGKVSFHSDFWCSRSRPILSHEAFLSVSTMADPYAHQYPPPAPVAPDPYAQHHYPPSPFANSQQQQAYDPSYLAHQGQQVPATPENAVPLQERHGQPKSAATGYNDPQAISLSDYVEAERQEHLAKVNQHHQHQQYGYSDYGYYQDNPNYNHDAAYHTPYTQYHDEPDYSVPATAPMVQQDASKNHRQRPPAAGPTLAPEHEADSYKPKPYQRPLRDDGCSCCCYNPAMTCCSCFCMILSLAFLAAGIALIISASVIQGKCQNSCDGLPDEISSSTPCDTICGKVVHDALFWSGVGITAISGIAVIWRLFMWICAGASRR